METVKTTAFLVLLLAPALHAGDFKPGPAPNTAASDVERTVDATSAFDYIAPDPASGLLKELHEKDNHFPESK